MSKIQQVKELNQNKKLIKQIRLDAVTAYKMAVKPLYMTYREIPHAQTRLIIGQAIINHILAKSYDDISRRKNRKVKKEVVYVDSSVGIEPEEHSFGKKRRSTRRRNVQNIASENRQK